MMRTEHDLLGDREVPEEVYYGIHTLRAVENFPVTGRPISSRPELITAVAAVKWAAACTNRELGSLAPAAADAIIKACQELIAGRFHDQFVVDVIQGGAGTSTNMNANEVIANRALEHLGHPRGAYERLHPLEHVNLAQSTNDVYPTALRVGLLAVLPNLRRSISDLAEAFAAKGEQYRNVLKIGRTQLQDAVPMTLGQEFVAYGMTLHEELARYDEAAALLCEINLGGTAIGTGLNTHPEYAQRVTEHLATITGRDLKGSANLVEATQDTGVFIYLSGVLKRTAVKMSKICNDLRLLSSGPRSGFGEINLPPVQAGSSIMPGKVNPVIPEVINQVAFRVIGHDSAVTMAAEGGQLQLNAFEPIIADSLFDSVDLLTRGSRILADKCVEGITANTELLRQRFDTSLGLVTALNPHIGYATATALAKEALASNRTIASLVLERGLLPKERLASIMAPGNLTRTTAETAAESS